jgi:hypothetical protein
MTVHEGADLQVKWKERENRKFCNHPTLELEWNEQGSLTGNYVCNLCGESVARGPRLTLARA